MARTYKQKRGSADRTEQSVTHDVNLEAAGLLYDMAALQPTPRSQFGYKRAAKAIVYLPMPVSDLVVAGTLVGVNSSSIGMNSPPPGPLSACT